MDWIKRLMACPLHEKLLDRNDLDKHACAILGGLLLWGVYYYMSMDLILKLR